VSGSGGGAGPRFSILGPLSVTGEQGRACGLEPRQARVLAVLLLAANRVVARQQLIDAVWDETPPATARRQLQNCVSSLRRRLAAAGAAAQVIVADGPGYRIRVGDGQLDAQVFLDRLGQAQALRAAGRFAEAVDRFREGLALWRGPALAGCPGQAIGAGAARLDERRVAALESCVDLELRLGRHAQLVGELTELVAAHPLREGLVGRLMRALDGSGRRAEALAAFRALTTRLADELGLDPSQSLRELHGAILRNEMATAGEPAPDPVANAGPVTHADPLTRADAVADPAAGPVRVVPRQLPVAVRHFVGRAAELKELTGLIADADAPGATVVITAIDGSAGIGKTAMAVHWAHRVAEDFPDGQLYVNLRGFDPHCPPVAAGEAIRGFLDAFQVPAGQIPAGLDAQAALYRSLIAGRRVLVLLDNARDADQVRPLLPGSPTCLALVTSRNRLTSLVAAESAHLVTLDVLTPGESQDLLARRLGPEQLAREPEAVRDLVTRCARLPLALAIVAARVTANPAFPLRAFADELADAHRRLDVLDAGDQSTQVRAVFSWSYRRLSEPAARLFRLLGLHPGADIGRPAVASLAGEPPSRVPPLLAELTRAHLLTEHAPDRFAFHDLLRAYAADLAATTDPPGTRRDAVRRVLDHYLHTAYAAARRLEPHRDPIALAGPAPGVTPEPLAELADPLAWFGAEHAVLLAAVRHAAATGFDPHTWQLAWALSLFLHRLGHLDDWVATMRAALAATERLADRTAQAYVQRSLAGAYAELCRYDDAHAHLCQALDLLGRLGDHMGQARTHLVAGHVFGRQGRYRDSLGEATRALDLFRTAGNLTGQADALNGIGWCHAQLGEYRPALAACEEAIAVHRELGDRGGEAATWDSLGYIHHHLGDHRRAIACYRRGVELCRAVGNRHWEADTLTHLGDACAEDRDPDGAAEAWRRALGILDHLGRSEAVAALRTKLHALHAQGVA
jgi:DNA-binding SARP family transcriptional activator